MSRAEASRLLVTPCFGLAGCDGGKSFHYMQKLVSGDLKEARDWPYVDESKRWKVAEHTSFSEGYTKRPATRRCINQKKPIVVLTNMVASWDEQCSMSIPKGTLSISC